MSIPRKIHYCWFGGKAKLKKIEECLASWAILGDMRLSNGMKAILMLIVMIM